jgi:DNA recombination protein RmuC
VIVTANCHDMPMGTSLGIFYGIAIGLFLGSLVGFLLGRLRASQSTGAILATAAALETETAKLLAEQTKVTLLTAQLDGVRAEQSQNTRLDEALKAVHQNMATLATAAQEAEVKRAAAEGGIKIQMESMRLGNENLLRETTKLAGALSNSQTRGKYGETQLEMLLENSGLQEGVHFFKQDYRSTDSQISKPDIKIAIPGGSEIFIDSKFPFNRFLDAIAEKDPVKRSDLMQLHAKDLMGHVAALAKRGYSESAQSPDYVVLFAPFESILSEALEVDPLILHKAFEKGVTIATPTTMMALLRTVAFVFSQSDMAHNAAAIKELAGELIKRIGRVHTKISKLGGAIKSSERAYNELVQSAEENMLRPARKMVVLGVPSGSKLKPIEGVDDELRVIKVASDRREIPAAQFDEDELDTDEKSEEVAENEDHDD